jgi:hypothetical protein
MKKRTKVFFAVICLSVTASCGTIGGTIVGAGIGSIAGNSELGAAVGFTAGVVSDLFGRK